ncbi:SDR family NAD(P)-dependent oxidoreductase [Streptomyces sp. NBC_00555]|uniref:type I polyketide synthase n=1 Tax=Streptomyces sp. NBC_00555 TaxID=2903662 RepID=UPI0022508E36|nr:type I polyketide synthase [Streptomyces sp. NBC_00555]MCX5016602.1 SDR family NAD(P)-dependent oxidoreductase [Streptomyces sp. NBC_00555]
MNADDIAIIGLGCRLPGGIDSPAALWQGLLDGIDAIGEVPPQRWRADDWHDVDPSAPGKMTTRWGGFLDDVAGFDAAFFGISPTEAAQMDPQQRVALEVAWAAVEDARIRTDRLAESATGVFFGTMWQEYHLATGASAGEIRTHTAIGTDTSIIPARIAYALDLRGPVMSVGTGCSSSLVAIHQAVRSLRSGESDLALAGGVSLILHPHTTVAMSKFGTQNPDGQCRAFDADANGYVRGEGCGVVVLRRLGDARRSGDRIYAVIRGSAVNNDGTTDGLATPSADTQAEVLRSAWREAGTDPGLVSYVEAHGTGTRRGDPIEAAALGSVFGDGRKTGEPLRIGSAKTNFGHLEPAAGVLGVLKTSLALFHGELPPSLHFRRPNPDIDFDAANLAVVTDRQPWPQGARLAGVSSFGYGGTNAHLALAGPPPARAAEVREPAARTRIPWVLSARSEEALRERAGRLRAHLAAHPGLSAADVGFSLATTRADHEYRAVLLGRETADLSRGLEALASGAQVPDLVVGSGRGRGPVLMFAGQGAQWAGMAAELLDSSPVFAERFAQCEAALGPFVDWKLTEVIGNADALERVDVVQPALWAMMVSLARLWKHFGVDPDVLLGHSQGEIAAACLSGALSLEDAAAVVALRARAIRRGLAGRGGMVSLVCSRADALRLTGRWPDRLSVAAVNGPRSTVVSGDPEALAELLAHCGSAGIRAKRVPVDYASHSAQVEAIREDILTDLAGIRPRPGAAGFFSTVDVGRIDTATLDAGYWYRNLRSTVELDACVRELAAEGRSVFIECTPHPVLTMGVEESAEVRTVGTLRRQEGDRFLTALAEAYAAGVDVDWSRAFERANTVDLPTYPFRHQRYWIDGAADGGGPAQDAPFWDAVGREDLDGVARTLGLDRDALAPVLPALASWRRRRTSESVVDGWEYKAAWTEVPGPAVRPGDWLALAPAGDAWARSVAGALTGQGLRVTLMELEPGLDRGALAARLRGTACDGVLCLPAAQDGPYTGYTGVPAGYAATLTAVQALGDAGVSAPLWCVTRDAAAVADEAVDPEGSLVWGLGRVVALEHSERWGGLVDLSSAYDPGVLAGVLTGDHGEDQVAIRGSVPHGRRLVRAAAGPARGWSPTGTVLITGGTGALGAEVARRLAGQGAERLVLVSRSGPDAPGARALTADLQRLGAGVEIVACDVADREAVRGLVERTRPDAVVHAAGALHDGLVQDLTPDRVDAALRVKAQGAWNLHELAPGLDAFVLFSSWGATVGVPGQGNYAPGNAYLDGLAALRHSQGLPATSVAWGPWAGDGMARGPVKEVLDRHGVPAMAPDLALLALDRAVASAEPCVTVADVRWDRFRTVFTATRPSALLADLPDGRDASAVQEPAFRRRLAELPADGRMRAAREEVRAQTALVLGHPTPEAVDVERTFRELAFDSVLGVELRNRLGAVTGLRLPTTLIFDHPTPAQVAAHILDAYLHEEPDPAAGETAPAARTATATPAAAPEAAPSGAPEAGAGEPIAIVAMSCRFPGGVRDPEGFWRLLSDGGDAITPFPEDRGWDLSALYHPDPDHPGTSYVREGGFVAAADFDPEFFGISPREALTMDPQQRILLEGSWELLERAGIAPAALKGSDTGIYLGTNGQDYASLGTPHGSEGFGLTGSAASVVSGRVSYALGLEGPSVTVDTACSASLVAIHLAAQALSRGECAMAVAGGATVMATPRLFVGFSRQHGLDPLGRCRAFSDGASGTALSEGSGLLLLEKLSDARRNGHPVLAVIRGSAVNQDGTSNGLTAPNGRAQQQVIRKALAAAGLEASDVDVVEAHGTGTTLGDPIEARALQATYGASGRPVWLGSVKSNIGHTQAAAGVAGVIKMVLAMNHGTVPRTLHADTPSRHVDWSEGSLRLVTDPVAWDADGPRRAGVSSFGISGTNAHLILEQAAGAEEPPAGAEEPAAGPRPALLPWTLSARTPEALREQASRLAVRVGTHPGTDPADLAFSLATSRTSFRERAVVVGRDTGDLLAGLRAITDGASSASVVEGSADDGRTAFVFAGQGTQRAGMGADLRAAYPVFDAAWREIRAALDPHLRRPLAEVIDDPDALRRTEFTQPALFAFEVAVFRLLESWGLTPDLVLGHSVGELSAAHVAGVLSLEDACALVAARGRLMQARPDTGVMLALQAGEHEVAPLLSARVHLAAVNGPRSVVIAGDADAVAEVAGRFTGRRTKRLNVSHAFHSAHMDGMLDEFRSVAERLTFHPPRIALVTNLTGRTVTDCGPDHWVRQVRQPVRFADAIRTARGEGVTRFLDIGPDGTPAAMIEDCLDGDDAVVVPTQRADRSGPEALTLAVARAHTAGAGPDWAPLLGEGRRRVDLPTYAFQRKRFWPDGSGSGAGHPWLTEVTELADGGWVLSGRVSASSQPWLADHVVFGTVVVPGTALLDMVLAGAGQAGAAGVGELTLSRPMVLEDAVHVQVRIGPADGGRRPVTLHGKAEGTGTWSTHAEGVLVDAFGPEPTDWSVPALPAVDLAGFYEGFAAQGVDYGAAFHGVAELRGQGGTACGVVRLPAGEPGGFGVHPALLDAALQVMRAAVPASAEAQLPFQFTDVRLYATGATELRVRVDVRDDGIRAAITDPAGAPVAYVGALRLRPVSAGLLRAALTVPDLYRVAFRPVPQVPAVAEPVRVLGSGPVSEALGVTPSETVTEDGPRRILIDATAHAEGVAAAHESAARALDLLRRLVPRRGLELVWITRDSIAARPGDRVRGLAQAPLWGLLRAARREHPEAALRIVDCDRIDAPTLLSALSVSGEPELAVRGGEFLAPRLTAAGAAGVAGAAGAAGAGSVADGTVLVTGGTGELGRAVARHLVTEHGVRDLVLTSRSGPGNPEAGSLVAELTGAGARSVRVLACDVSDRTQVAGVLSSAGDWSAVLHLAGVLDDGLLLDYDERRLRTVLAPKLDGAAHLAELTADLGLSAFVLFSSVSGTLGSAGQGAYAAANAYLDALAARSGGTSLAWGLWEQAGSGMTAHLTEAELGRLRRQGIAPLPVAKALRLLDRALRSPDGNLVPVRLDLAALDGEPPALLRGLVRPALRRAGEDRAGGGLRKRLEGRTPEEQAASVTRLVLEEAAVVLGLPGPGGLRSKAVLKDLGLDSLMAMELRRRLANAAEVPLPASLAFDHPTPADIAELLMRRMGIARAESGTEPEPEASPDPAAPAPARSVAEIGAELDALLEL